MTVPKTGLLAFVYGLVGLVVLGGNKSVPKLIQNAAKTTALWAARSYIAWHERQTQEKDTAKANKASDEAFDKRYSMGTLVRVVSGPNAGMVGRVRWDNVQSDASGTHRRITIMTGDGRHTRAIIEEPGNVVPEPEKQTVADPANGGGSGGSSTGAVKLSALPPFHELIKAAIHAAWNVDLSGMAEGEEGLALIFAGPEGSDGDVAGCAAEFQRLIELDPFKAAYESAHTMKYTFGKTIHRHDGRRVCVRIAPPLMWASLTPGHALVFFGFTDSALATYGENAGALALAVQECRQRLIGPDGIEWGKKLDPDEQSADAGNDVSLPAPEDTAAPEDPGSKELAVDDWVRVSPEHPAHGNKIGKIIRFGNYRENAVLDFSSGGPMQMATIEVRYLSKPAQSVGNSLRREKRLPRKGA